ncbi:MAG: DUF5060 domain-containing protein [Bacteroidia bacterium]|nr:DUF5060 domain-containing protein [Bacteroidia bacterium]
MKKHYTLLIFTVFTFLLHPAMFALPVINGLTPTATTVELYEKFEVAVNLTASYTNPYDYDQIRVFATFTAPGGEQKVVDGFFMKDYTLTAAGTLNATGTEGFKVRFSPDETGNWTYVVSVTDNSGTVAYSSQAFTCNPATNIKNKGFVRTGVTKYLQHDNGDQYIPVGENVAWQLANPFVDYTNWLGGLAANNANFFRLWHAHWGLGIEWRNGSDNFLGLRKYKETNCRYQDWLYDYCAQNGIYVMLCLQHHGQVSAQTNPNWADNPYNANLGGPCQNTWDFFSNSTAKAHTKNRFRYIVARWGYARSIMAWELFNEVDLTDDFDTHKGTVSDWHDEMAAYIKSIDLYGHILTTSFAHDKNDPAIWTAPDMDMTQTHFYLNTAHIERVVVRGITNYLEDYDKPTLSGEFGLGGSSSISNQDPDGVHIHNSLWAAVFAGGLGTAMTWWWDSYIHPKNLYYHFKPVAAVSQEIPFVDGNMAPAAAFVSGAPGDLSLTPSLNWGEIATANITINQGGSLSPSDASLAVYMYGSTWNTQFRSPPTFQITYPDAGLFTVKTGGTAGTDPKIAIWLDGTKLLEQSAQINQNYSINVPAGAHTIKVDNTGTDWITISSYTFTNAGSSVDVYALVSADSSTAAGWVYSNNYNHEYIKTNGKPAAIYNSQVSVSGFQDGAYYVKWYNCLTGAIVLGAPAYATNNVLQINVPKLDWDLAFRVDDEFSNVAIDREIRSLDFSVYPNPVNRGENLHIKYAAKDNNAHITLLDMAGKPLSEFSIPRLTTGRQDIIFPLPDNLAAGVYWLLLNSGEERGVEPFVVK